MMCEARKGVGMNLFGFDESERPVFTGTFGLLFFGDRFLQHFGTK